MALGWPICVSAFLCVFRVVTSEPGSGQSAAARLLKAETISCSQHSDCQLPQCNGNDREAFCCAPFGCGNVCVTQYEDPRQCPGSPAGRDKDGNEIWQCWKTKLQSYCQATPGQATPGSQMTSIKSQCRSKLVCLDVEDNVCPKFSHQSGGWAKQRKGLFFAGLAREENPDEKCCPHLEKLLQCMSPDCFANWLGTSLASSWKQNHPKGRNPMYKWIEVCPDAPLPTLFSIHSYAERREERNVKGGGGPQLKPTCMAKMPGSGCPGVRDFQKCNEMVLTGKADADSECCSDLAKQMECMGKDCFANLVGTMIAKDDNAVEGTKMWMQACPRIDYPPLSAMLAYAGKSAKPKKDEGQRAVLKDGCKAKWPMPTGRCPGVRGFEECNRKVQAGQLPPGSTCCQDLAREVDCMGQDCFANHVGLLISKDIHGGIEGTKKWYAACPAIRFPRIESIKAYAKGEDGSALLGTAWQIHNSTDSGSTWSSNLFGKLEQRQTLALVFVAGAVVALIGSVVSAVVFLLTRKIWRRRWLVSTAAPSDVPLCQVASADDGLEDMTSCRQGLTVTLPEETSAMYQQC